MKFEERDLLDALSRGQFPKEMVEDPTGRELIKEFIRFEHAEHDAADGQRWVLFRYITVSDCGAKQ